MMQISRRYRDHHQVTGYYKDQCSRYGCQPQPRPIIYRANILIAETVERAQPALAQ